MKLDDWLAQRSQSCPDRTALVADGAEVTYAELEAEATWVARRLAAHGVRRGSIAALTMHPRREQVVLAHALMKVGATLLPLSPRLTEAERAAIVAAEEPIVDLDDPGELTQTEADLPLLGEHDMDDICARVLTSGSTGAPKPVGLTYGNFLWSAVGSGFNIGVEPERPLALLPAAQPHLRPRDRDALGRSTAPPRSLHDGFDVDRVAAALERGRDHRRLAGDDDADPPARRRRRPLRPAGDPGRRRPGARGAAGGGDRQGRHRGPDLRPDRDLLAGDDAGPGRRAAQARLRRPAAADHPPADPATARSSSRARPSPRAAPTPTAGCTPATSAASTRRASSTSRTGSTT